MLSAVTVRLEREHTILLGLALLVLVLWMLRRGLKRGRTVDANFWARTTAAGILVLGLLVVVLPGLSHLSLQEDPFRPPAERKTVTKTDADGKVSREVTESPASQSLLERGLARGGLLFLRLGVVLLAAFLAGAFVQRFVLGEFAVEVGGLKLPALADQAATSVEKLKEVVAKQETRIEQVSAATREALVDLDASLKGVRASIAEEQENLRAVRADTEALRQKVDQLGEEAASPTADNQ